MIKVERISKVIVQRLSDLVQTDRAKFNTICDLLDIDDRQPFIDQAYRRLIAERIHITFHDILCSLPDVIKDLPPEFAVTIKYTHPQGTMSILVDSAPRERMRPKDSMGKTLNERIGDRLDAIEKTLNERIGDRLVASTRY